MKTDNLRQEQEGQDKTLLTIIPSPCMNINITSTAQKLDRWISISLKAVEYFLTCWTYLNLYNDVLAKPF